MDDKCCENCRWRSGIGHVLACTNYDSENYGDYVEDEDWCDEWEEDHWE